MRVGVVGATGQVGTVMRALLEQRNFPMTELRFLHLLGQPENRCNGVTDQSWWKTQTLPIQVV